MHLPYLCKNVINANGEEGLVGFLQTFILCVRYLCKVAYATDKFIYAPSFNYNEVMCFLKFMGVAEQALCSDSEGHGTIILR